MGVMTSSVTQPTGRTFFSFLKRNSDGVYYNAVAAGFQAFNPVTADEATRAPFRVSYVENQVVAGQYEWTVDVAAFVEGSYTLVSRELVGVSEFAPILTQTVTVTNGSVSEGELRFELDYAGGRTLFLFLERLSDGLFYVPASDSFSLFSLASAPEAERAGFRVPFTEDADGKYSIEINVSDFPDGSYTVYTRELAAGIEILAGSAQTILVANGGVSEGVSLGEVGLTHNTGDPDNFKYVTDGGAPIEGATIRVFLKADFDSGVLDTVKGVAYTNSLGRWQNPVFVTPGNTYTLVFSKTGYFGPDVVEVTV